MTYKQKIYDSLADGPLTVKEIADKVCRPSSSVYRYMYLLRAECHVEQVRPSGRVIRWKQSAPGGRAVASRRPSRVLNALDYLGQSTAKQLARNLARKEGSVCSELSRLARAGRVRCAGFKGGLKVWEAVR